MTSEPSPQPIPELYRVTFEIRPTYLYAYVEGDHDSYEISHSFWQEIANEAKRLKIRKVLIDENILENASMADVFQLASEIPNMGFGKVAFVDRYLDQQEINAFGELVAVNRGLNGKIFNDVSEAEAWLLSESR